MSDQLELEIQMTKGFFAALKIDPIQLPDHYPSASSARRRLVREQYQDLQENRCYHCDAPLSCEPPEEMTKLNVNEQLFPKNFFDYPVHLHHDHNTGMTIGAVHAWCNAVLWQYYGE